MKDISAVFHHCHTVLERDGVYSPVRFSEARIGEYLIYRPACCYSRCTAGVTMEFSTDAAVIGFEYEIRPAQDGYSTSDVFDVYENGEFTATVFPSIHAGPFRYKLRNTGRTEVRIYLPVGVDVRFSKIELGDWQPVLSPAKKLLIAGDSISQGLFGLHPSLALAPRLSRALGCDYLNTSVGGDCFRAGLIPADLDFAPDAIIVELGTNDLGFVGDMVKIKKNVDEFFAELCARFPGVPAVVLTPFKMTNFGEAEAKERETYTEELFRYVEKVCTPLSQVTLIDGRAVIPQEYENYADICHPSDEGFAAIAAAVTPPLVNALG